MSETPRFYLTTAIDYPNSRPHLGTAFEKIGADVQARYRRMEGYDVHFLMGNDENTIKVAKRAVELQRDPKEYCDDMARQFKEILDLQGQLRGPLLRRLRGIQDRTRSGRERPLCESPAHAAHSPQ